MCISLNLDIFVTFMGRLEEMPHRQVLMYGCACAPRVYTVRFTCVRRKHHIRAFQGLNSVLVQYIFRIFNVCQITRKIALSSRAGPGKHAREGVFRIGPRVRLICHFCQNDALKTLAGQRSRVHFRANAHFWRVFALVAERVRGMSVHRVANIIDCVAYFSESTI